MNDISRVKVGDRVTTNGSQGNLRADDMRITGLVVKADSRSVDICQETTGSGIVCSCHNRKTWMVSDCSSHPGFYFEILNLDRPRSMSNKLKTLFKKLVDTRTQKLVKAGLLDENLQITEKGEEVLCDILFLENMDKLVEKADEIIKDEEAEKGKACKA